MAERGWPLESLGRSGLTFQFYQLLVRWPWAFPRQLPLLSKETKNTHNVGLL